MVQINLLPDVKQHFIKAKRIQKLIITSAVAVASVSLGTFIVLFVAVNLFQKQQSSSLSRDIAKLSNDLKKIPDIDRILTVQAQLKTLPELHAQKPAAKRLTDFLTKVTPLSTTISKLNVDFETNTIILSGAADKLETVNKFADTLKFTGYKKDPESSETRAFSSVVLENFGRDSKGAIYKINLVFDPAIFDSANKQLALVVPAIVTTRSETERPALFKQGDPAVLNNGQGGN